MTFAECFPETARDYFWNLQRLQKGAASIGREPGVGVKQNDGVSRCLRAALPELATAAGFGREDLAVCACSDGSCFVGASGINDDDFEHFRNRPCVPKRFWQFLSFVQCWYNNRKRRLFDSIVALMCGAR